MNDALLARVRDCPTLPLLPAVAAQVMQACGHNDSEPRHVAQLISRDPGLVLRLLKTVNGSAYGQTRKITAIEQAVLILGLRNVGTLVCAAGLFPALKQCAAEGFDHGAYYRRSLYSATAAQLLAQQLKTADPRHCFLAALLMDVGMLALAHVLDRQYVQIVGRPDRHVDLEPLETRILDLAHPAVGAALAERWNLPPNLLLPILHHHDPQNAPEGEARQIAGIARLASLCADIFVEHDPLWPIAEIERLLQADYGMNRQATGELLTALAADTRELASVFDVQIDGKATFAEAEHRAAEDLASGLTAGSGGAASGEGGTNVACRGVVWVFPLAGEAIGRPMRVGCIDVSAHGLGLKFAQPVVSGMRLIVGLPRGPGHASVLQYIVRRCHPLAEPASYFVGVQLERVLRQEEFSSTELPRELRPLQMFGRALAARGTGAAVAAAADGGDRAASSAGAATAVSASATHSPDFAAAAPDAAKSRVAKTIGAPAARHAVPMQMGSMDATEDGPDVTRPTAVGQTQTAPESAADATPAERPRAILVIDDDTAVSARVVKLLAKLGHAAEAIATGREALARLQHVDAQMVVMEFLLPDIDGLEILRTIRGTQRTQAVPVVMFTRIADRAMRAYALKQGATEFLMKESAWGKLEGRLHELLKGARAGKAA